MQSDNQDVSVQSSDVSLIEDKLGNALNLYCKILLAKAFKSLKKSAIDGLEDTHEMEKNEM